MKKSVMIFLLAAFVAACCPSCTKIPAGYVGIKVRMYGSDKGVAAEPVGVGRYWDGVNIEYFRFPTYQVNYVYTRDKTEGSPKNEEFTFQTKEGMECSVDLGVAMQFEADKVPLMFQTYRKGEEDIRGIVVRNDIRDRLNKIAGSMPVEYVYGEGKGKLVDSVQSLVHKDLVNTGINVQKVFLIGSIRIPGSVKDALDAKVKMTQEAQQKENEVLKAKAQADIDIAQATGKGQAILVEAQKQAEANRVLAASLTDELIRYKSIEKWNGSLPQVSGGGTVPFLNLNLK